jgi:hypothetical protein
MAHRVLAALLLVVAVLVVALIGFGVIAGVWLWPAWAVLVVTFLWLVVLYRANRW